MNCNQVSRIGFLTTGGTIDKVYFDDKGAYEIGEPILDEMLKRAKVVFDYEIKSILMKDSLHMTSQDRELILKEVLSFPYERIVITHGTDTMVNSAECLKSVTNKVVVLIGSLLPARFRDSDADLNIGFALGAVQSLPYGVYIAMNGRVYPWNKVRKNVEKNCFEAIE